MKEKEPIYFRKAIMKLLGNWKLGEHDTNSTIHQLGSWIFNANDFVKKNVK